MEQIEFWRTADDTLDEYNNPVPGARTKYLDIGAYAWPAMDADTVEVGRDARITGYKIVIRTPVPTGIRDTDEVIVKGESFVIDGDIGPWNTHSGVYKGEELAVKRGVG